MGGQDSSAGVAAGGGAVEVFYPAVDLSVPQLTVRAILTGMILGAILSVSNIYAGLKLGWGFNMSVTAALLSFGFWKALSRGFGLRSWNLLENNINQTAASSAASISSAGLVAPIPALTMLTGTELRWPVLALWCFAVSLVGVVVAIGLRRQMLVEEKLPFPNGIATAETLKEMYAHGKEAVTRVLMLVGAGALAAAVHILVKVFKVTKLAWPGSVAAKAGGALQAQGIGQVTLKNLGFAFDPSLLMVGVGALIGFRTGVSLLLGAVGAWMVVGPMALDLGWAHAPAAESARGGYWFGAMIKWMLWPGVAMMVTASLTSFAFSWRSVLNALSGKRRGRARSVEQTHEVPRRFFIGGLLIALVFATACQVGIFGIGVLLAAFGVLLTFMLAVVAARVSGETGITPVGPMGKVTQLIFGGLAPGNATANLMAANVTGGAASQCADLLHDMKTGQMVGASPRYQALAQTFGVLAGSLAGAAAYLVMIPDPRTMLLTEEWPAPAVAQWKAVAEVFTEGFDKMPAGAVSAMLWAGGLGILLAVMEKGLPRRLVRFVPSASAIGLAMVIPPFYAISMFLGGLLGFAASKLFKRWSTRFLVVVAAGLIAGDSLTGAVAAIIKALTDLAQTGVATAG